MKVFVLIVNLLVFQLAIAQNLISWDELQAKAGEPEYGKSQFLNTRTAKELLSKGSDRLIYQMIGHTNPVIALWGFYLLSERNSEIAYQAALALGSSIENKHLYSFGEVYLYLKTNKVDQSTFDKGFTPVIQNVSEKD